MASVRCLEHALEPGALGDTGSSGARLHERHARARLMALRAVLHGRLARRTLWLREAAEALERPAGQPAAALPVLEVLLCGSEALQLDHPISRTLRSVVARGREWEATARLHVSSRTTHTPDALIALLERADTLPASLPTRPTLEAVLNAARRWQAAADSLLETARPPPERLWNPSAAAGESAIQALLEQPEATQLLLPQAAELERELRRRGWLGRCAGALAPAMTPDLEIVRAALTDAHELQLEHLAEASELRTRFNAAAKWAQRANLALRRRSTLVALEAMRAEASELSVGVEQLAEVDERIQRASAWAARAKAALSVGAAQLDEVRALLAERPACMRSPRRALLAERPACMRSPRHPFPPFPTGARPARRVAVSRGGRARGGADRLTGEGHRVVAQAGFECLPQAWHRDCAARAARARRRHSRTA